MSQILATISTSFIVISAVFVALGWAAIKKKKVHIHIRRMIYAAIFATIFFIVYITRTSLMGNTVFGGPDNLKSAYLTFLVFHILLATVGGVMGLVTIYYGWKKRYDKHRRIGPWTSIVWFSTAITGVMVYMLLYIIYPPGGSDNPLNIIFGS